MRFGKSSAISMNSPAVILSTSSGGTGGAIAPMKILLLSLQGPELKWDGTAAGYLRFLEKCWFEGDNLSEIH